MYADGYTVEVSSLPARATEKDVYNFFIHCGAIHHVEILRSGECSCSAYVTFKDAFAQETAIVLSGATIGDQTVNITLWGAYADDFDPWDGHYRTAEYSSRLTGSQSVQYIWTPVETVTAVQVVKTMIAKGYMLGKETLIRAMALDASYRLSATAAAKIAELSHRVGLTDKIAAGMGAAKSVNDRYGVSSITKTAAVATSQAAYATGRTAVTAANAIVNSSYFRRGALCVSDALTRAAKATADMGACTIEKPMENGS